MKFLDQAKVFIKSGNGGNGCVSFRREKYVEFGGPNGGNGGRGGDVIIRCVNNLNTLIDFRYQQHFKAGAGGGGMGQNRNGKKGDDRIMYVPIGTQVMDEFEDTVICDLIHEGQEFVLAHGGDGGRGNTSFKSSTNQAPRRFETGWPGEEFWIWLKLKIIADVGLIGFPNAGKSTFLSAVSAATPKIADYPFTTLNPGLGIVYLDKMANGQEFIVADLPGLIEGASQGHGLGDKFLKHIERTNILLHMIDIHTPDIAESYEKIRQELQFYGHNVANKPEIIALNKIDTMPDIDIEHQVNELKKVTNNPIFTISAVAQTNINDLIYTLSDKVHQSKKVTEQENQTTKWQP